MYLLIRVRVRVGVGVRVRVRVSFSGRGVPSANDVAEEHSRSGPSFNETLFVPVTESLGGAASMLLALASINTKRR